jgi:demethylmenaquinone methyltransferase/2-methoxy-6-polyprenyl-1,4-benzoquinol methylase
LTPRPRAALRAAIATPDGKRRYVRGLFATIADRYDFITRFLSYGQDRRWKRRLIRLARLRAGDRVLDLACGTGDLAYAASKEASRVMGLDVTHRMLQLAAGRQADSGSGEGGRSRPPGAPGTPGPRVSFVTGDMLALPFPDAQFDVVTTGYGLRNVPDLPLALSEIHRVLVPGGRLLSLDFNKPASRVVRSAYLAYLTVVGSTLGFALHRDPDTYRYIPESIRQYPGAQGVAKLLDAQGFTSVEVIPLLGGLMAIHVGQRSKVKGQR